MSPAVSLCLIFFVLWCCLSLLLLWIASYRTIRRKLTVVSRVSPIPFPQQDPSFCLRPWAVHSDFHLLVTGSASL